THVAPKIGPYSKPHRFWHVDGRTREGIFLVAVKRELARHVGPNPTVAQQLLIERAAITALKLNQIDKRIIEGREFTLMDNNATIAWTNALTRILVALGVQKSIPLRTRHDAILNEVTGNVG